MTSYEMGSAVFVAVLLAEVLKLFFHFTIAYVVHRGKVKAANEAVDRLAAQIQTLQEIKRESDQRFN